jgi:acyl-CoA dehydrogenase
VEQGVATCEAERSTPDAKTPEVCAVDFTESDKVRALKRALTEFMDTHVYPAEALYDEQLASGGPHHLPPIVRELQTKARAAGLWNLFLPHATEWTDGLSNLEYAPLAEVMGRVKWAPEVFNCSAPDTGNMEILTLYGSDEQKERWLKPLLDAEIRSCFAMTEPAVASSDANNIECRIRRDGDEYVIDGHKWWITGSADPRCTVAIVMGKTDPDAPTHTQQSMVVVPLDTPGVTRGRNFTVFGYADQEGHCELRFEGVRVPAANLLGKEGEGFAIAQARLGPGRIHHCMRSIGVAERAFELLCRRVRSRTVFGGPLSEQGVVQQWIAQSRVEIDQARLYTLWASWLMDTQGNRAARTAIAGIKVAVPSMAAGVVDRAIQAHGAMGVGPDVPLASMYAHLRTLRILDGPDEVHRRAIARSELDRVCGPAAR